MPAPSENAPRFVKENYCLEQLSIPGLIHRHMENRKIMLEQIKAELRRRGFLYRNFTRDGKELKQRVQTLKDQIAFGQMWLSIASVRTNTIADRLRVVSRVVREFEELQKQFQQQHQQGRLSARDLESNYRAAGVRIDHELYGRSLVGKMLWKTSSGDKELSLEERIGEAFLPLAT